MTLSTSRASDRAKSQPALSYIYTRLKLSALRPASVLTGHKLTTIDGIPGVGRDGPPLIEAYLNRCPGHWFESLCVQVSVKVLISAFAPGNMCYLRVLSSLCELELSARFPPPFLHTQIVSYIE